MIAPSFPGNSSTVVLITGCSSGIGRATALAFAAAGFPTFATARNVASLAALQAAGCRVLRLDVTDEAGMRASVLEAEAMTGSVGVLVNNAGYPVYGPVEQLDPDALRTEFETNVLGLVRMTQLVLPGMRRAGRGRIINVSSVAGRVVMPGGGAYHASKFAVEAFADALRPEVAPFGVAVVNVRPGPVETRFQEKMLQGLPAAGPDDPYAPLKRRVARIMRSSAKPGRWQTLRPEDVAKVVLDAATVPRPRPYYAVGMLAKLTLAVVPHLPARLLDAAYRRLLWR